MIRYGAAVIVAALSVGVHPACSQVGSGQPGGMRMYAAVFTVRGSVVGRSVGGYGAFVRENADTVWRMLNMSNAFTYGLGLYRDSSSLIYYIAAGSGLQRSTDGGRSWKLLTSWQTREILGVAVDPTDASTLFVATPEWVYKTTDSGESWIPKKDGFRRWYIQRIMMDRLDRNVVYAAGEDDVYRTADGGESWVPLRTGVTQIQALYQSLSDPGLLLCSGEDAGIRVSGDRGRHWRRAAGLDSATLYAFAEIRETGELYAAGWETGVWKSTDRGETWRKLWNHPSIQAIFSIAVDPVNLRHIAIGTDGQGAYESFDAGATWSRAGLMGGKVKEIVFYP